MGKGRSVRSAVSSQVQKRTLSIPPWARSLTHEARAARQPVKVVLGPRGIDKEAAAVKDRVDAQLSATTQENRDLLKSLQSIPEDSLYVEDGYLMAVDEDAGGDGQNLDREWVDIEDESFVHDLETFSRSKYKGRISLFHKSWQARKERQMAAWDLLLEPLTQQYLRWKYPPPSYPTTSADDPLVPSTTSTSSPPSALCDPTPSSDDPAPPSPGSTPPSQASVPSSGVLSPQPTFPDTSILEPAPSSPSNSENVPDPVPADSAEPLEYTLEVYDIWTLKKELTILRRADSTSVALDLMEHGYIAKTPQRPFKAVSVRTLELLYRLRQRKASFSVEAFAKVLSDYYNIPFRRHMREVVGDTFEIYLRILRNVEIRVQDALGWNTPDWRVKNACRACCYELEGEPPLEFKRLVAIDGNNSLKRMLPVGDRKAADIRRLDSDYFIPREFVDRYAHEVKSRRVKNPRVKSRRSGDVTDSEDSDSDEETVPEEGGDPTDGSEHAGQSDPVCNTPVAVSPVSDPLVPGPPGAVPPAAESSNNDPPPEDVIQKALANRIREACVVNWKAAASEEKKRMWSIFDETGVFAAACRHGFLLWLIDMIRSGELAKYPLAIVSKILTTIGHRTGVGYDIGCDFEKTVANSSLGPEAKEKLLRFVVGAFHGYSHCYPCQLQYHPSVVPGMGLEDLETMERLFSASNHLASITRYASPYRRRLFIEAYFRQWDEDKNLNLGTFLLNNVKQALKIIEDETPGLLAAMESIPVSNEELDRYEREQFSFFASLGAEETHDPRELAYIELLEQLPELQKKRSRVFTRFVAFNPATTDQATYDQQVSATRKLETERRHAVEQHERVCRDVIALETELGISERWTPQHPKYQTTLKFVNERKYRRALDRLQSLVIKRMFELHRLNLSQTSYKMRTHISKSLQKRSKAIRTAVNAYNAAADTLSPPREHVDWDEISKYSFLEEFNLLQDTRHDVRDKNWTKPEVREVLKIRQRLARAHEELGRCAVELRRLHTAIRDERTLFERVLLNLRKSASPLYGAVFQFTEYRTSVNRHLITRIYQAYDQRGFTCNKFPGTRLGCVPLANPPDVLGDKGKAPQDPDEELDAEEEAGADEQGEDDITEEMRVVMDFISDLT